MIIKIGNLFESKLNNFTDNFRNGYIVCISVLSLYFDLQILMIFNIHDQYVATVLRLF